MKNLKLKSLNYLKILENNNIVSVRKFLPNDLMNKFLFIILTSPLLANASVDLKFISANEMVKRSDFIGIVKITEGKTTKSGFKIVAKLIDPLKGSKSEAIGFEHRLFSNGHRYTDYPDRLGGTYLVFLIDTGKGFMTLNQHFSVIEVQSIPVSRNVYDDILVPFKLELNDFQRFGNSYWYPTQCQKGSAELCSIVKSLFARAFNKMPAKESDKKRQPQLRASVIRN